MNSILAAAAQGILWGIMGLSVYLTYRCLDFPDLTVDGSLSTGAAVAAVLISTGTNAIVAILVATIVGVLCGAVTGLLHTVLKIPPILSGILSMLGLYSINMRIMGKANISLYNKDTIFSTFMKSTNLSANITQILLGFVIVVLIILILYWFFGTELGAAIRATGNNEAMIRALGVNTSYTKILALMISNGIVALCGAVVAQASGYAAVDMGTGAIVTGLAGVIIGEVVFGMRGSFMFKLGTVILGSVLYRLAVAGVLSLDIAKSSDLKLFTAIIVAIALALPVVKHSFAERMGRLVGGK